MSKNVEVDLCEDDAEWLKELDGKRLRLLERVARASATISDEPRKVRFELQEGGPEDGAAWAEHCLKAGLAMKEGETLDVQALPEATAGWTPPVKVLKIPKDEAKNFVLGKGGARLKEISDQLGVFALFVEEVGPVEPFVLKKGGLVEAKYEGGERWFEAEVKEIGEEKVTVRWTYDDDVPNGEVSKADIRALPKAKKETREAPLEVGDLIEAKFGGKERMFEAKVIKIDGDKLTVKWTYDDDVPEEKIDKEGIKRLPKPSIATLRIYGYNRGLLEAELKILQCVEGKVPGFAKANSSPCPEDSEDVGLVIVPLFNDGEMKAKCVGSKGSMRKKIVAASRGALEYLGNDCYIVGTLSERRRTAAIVELVQKQPNGEIEEIPKVLADMCTKISVAGYSSSAVMGAKRVNMNRVEEESETVSFWVTTVAEEEKDEEMKEESKLEPVVGEIYEARFSHPKGDRWFEAKVLKEIKGDKETLYQMEWQYDPDEQKSELIAADLRKVGSAPKNTGKPAATDKTLAIFGPEAGRKMAEEKVKALIDGKDPWESPDKDKEWLDSFGSDSKAGSKDWRESTEESASKKPRVEYIVTDEEEERRRKRAARFGLK